MRLLLLSNSRNPGGDYLAHAHAALATLMAGRTSAWFVPFAGVTVPWDDFTTVVAAALSPLGVRVTGAHTQPEPGPDDVILVGGGNTFHLLRECRRRALLDVMRARVRGGTPYAGWSAGANLTCPTIRTTNDMPIVDPGGFDALDLLTFQINPHFTNAMPPGHQGETREQRLTEFVTANPEVPVLGMPEGAWITVDGGAVMLCGPQDAVWIRAGAPVTPVPPGTLAAPFGGALTRS
ncbi:MAG TPA: dipeptidase PepE [Vicinamibacterales bacterium]|nr:dipeptidase PepE [Vicinamibacterales bacterium]